MFEPTIDLCADGGERIPFRTIACFHVGLAGVVGLVQEGPDLSHPLGLSDGFGSELLERVGGGTEGHQPRSGNRHQGQEHHDEHEEQSSSERAPLSGCCGSSSEERERAHVLHGRQTAAA